MPNTTSPPNILAYIKNLDDLACYYRNNKIIHSSEEFKKALDDLFLQQPNCNQIPSIDNESLEWLFRERAKVDETEFNTFARQAPFYSLFKVKLTINANQSSRILQGKSGSGLDTPETYLSGNLGTIQIHDNVINRPTQIPDIIGGPDPVPIDLHDHINTWQTEDSIHITPEMNENFRAGFLPITSLSPHRPIPVSSPKLVHITQPNFSILELFKSGAYTGNDILETCINMFKYLSSLPADKINEHGQKSTDTAMKAVQMAGQSSPQFSYVSSFYPELFPIPSRTIRRNSITPPPQISKSGFRPHNAFSSPTILNLKEGDVLFINQSFDINSSVPTLFDLSVCKITKWLESKGVIVIFSAGNAKKMLQLTDYFPNDTSLPGIMVGGVDETKTKFTSNYGDLITCYRFPVQLTTGEFGASSGATAYVAGLAWSIQQYRRSQNKSYLLPSQIKSLLSTCGISFTFDSTSGNIPTWDRLRPAIDQHP